LVDGDITMMAEIPTRYDAEQGVSKDDTMARSETNTYVVGGQRANDEATQDHNSEQPPPTDYNVTTVSNAIPTLEDDDILTPANNKNTNQSPAMSSGTCTSTTAGEKSIACAFSSTPFPSGTAHNNTNSPLDDTMAQAVGTLQIGHNNIHDTIPATTSPWTLVTKTGPAGKKAPDDTTTPSNIHEFGLAFERTTKANNWSTADLLLVLQTIQTHDPKAMLSSADNKTKPTLVTAILHKAQKDIPWFTKFTAMKTMTWGKPSDGTTKIVFSFWLTSTIIKKDLAQLRMDSDFTEMLKGTNTYMKVTNALR